jgi:hypothetical protein
MNPDSENFEQLRQLLALKRHEQPPPRYFNDFSSQVIARIRAEGMGKHPERAEGTWWERLWMSLEAKPVFAGAFGAGVCAVLVSGILSSGELMSATPGVRDLPANLQGNSFASGELPTKLLPEMSDSNSLALKAMFDSFQLQGQPVDFRQPVNFTFPRNAFTNGD